jgi:hypothetical protein
VPSGRESVPRRGKVLVTVVNGEAIDAAGAPARRRESYPRVRIPRNSHLTARAGSFRRPSTSIRDSSIGSGPRQRRPHDDEHAATHALAAVLYLGHDDDGSDFRGRDRASSEPPPHAASVVSSARKDPLWETAGAPGMPAAGMPELAVRRRSRQLDLSASLLDHTRSGDPSPSVPADAPGIRFEQESA